MADPFIIEGPALWSFSGGRTSGYMLWRALEAYDGQLPADHVVTFANTGKEREETLRFVHECETRWGVKVHWVERSDTNPRGFVDVDFDTASRSGEPFEALIAKKGYLPNSQARFCSVELKVRVMRDFCRAMDWKHWKSIVGLRADEPGRVQRAHAANAAGKERWQAVMPLAVAGISQRDVMAFWRNQDFDLQLLPFEGNCDACFLKARPKLFEVERTSPGTLQWWVDQERKAAAMETATASGSVFREGETYSQIQDAVKRQGDLFAGVFNNDPEMDAECGLWCGEAA